MVCSSGCVTELVTGVRDMLHCHWVRFVLLVSVHLSLVVRADCAVAGHLLARRLHGQYTANLLVQRDVSL